MERSHPWPFVTIALPCLDEAAHIESCLRDVLSQDYPADRFEVLVADGGSTDGTLDVLARLASEQAALRVVANPDRLQAPGLNCILRASRGQVIVRMDVHCQYTRDYVRRCVETLEHSGADNVGGAQRAIATTPFQRALCAALSSPLGMGGAAYRCPDKEGFVDTVFLGAFPRRVFETIGLYDPHAVTNEDAELNQRIRKAGGRIYLSRDIVVHYHPRDSLPALARQYFRYGRGRARTLLKHGRFLSMRPAIPFLMLVTAAAILSVPRLRPLFLWAIGAYASIVLLEAIRLGRDLGVAAIARMALIFPVLHLCHGTGFALGLVQYLLHPDWQPPERLGAPSSRLTHPGAPLC